MSTRSRNRTPAIAAAASVVSAVGVLGSLYYFDIPSLLRKRVKSRKVEPRCFALKNQPSIAAFRTITQQITLKETYPLAANVVQDIPIYYCNDFDLADTDKLNRLEDELYHNLVQGPGVYIMRHFFKDLDLIDTVNEAYDAIIADELAASGAKGDHFAPASANSRIWNSFSKHALKDPKSFTEYFSNPWFQIVCNSYLGPGYRITSQVNIVRPGGKAQMPHRDYHLGFATDAEVVQYPKAAHYISGLLTLQGAVAHTDMPADSGPTRLLPYSQHFDEGFRSYRSQPFIDYFEENFVALPLEKGDALFFSPALFHAAGENRTKDFSRSANLIQVSSCMGKTMETIDSFPLIEETYDLVLDKYNSEGFSAEVDAFIRAVADGYPFPTNLDCRPPGPGKMAPEGQQDLLARGIRDGWDKQRMMSELTDMREASDANGKVMRQTTVFGT